MSAVQDVTRQPQPQACAGSPRPMACPLLDEPPALIGYVTGVLACYLVLTGWGAARAPVTGGEVTLFVALMCCGAVCVEATRRLGQPTGVWRDLLSAWWLPVALLLPPLYALVAPAVLGLLSYVRVHHGPRAQAGHSGAVYRRVFSSAALGLAGAFASVLFRLSTPVASE